MHSNASFNVNLKPMPQPQIFSLDPAQFRTQLFWPFHNFDTDALSWTEFSETFTNVGEGDLGFNILPWNWHLWETRVFSVRIPRSRTRRKLLRYVSAIDLRP
jgi:hypothetical protein